MTVSTERATLKTLLKINTISTSTSDSTLINQIFEFIYGPDKSEPISTHALLNYLANLQIQPIKTDMQKTQERLAFGPTFQFGSGTHTKLMPEQFHSAWVSNTFKRKLLSIFKTSDRVLRPKFSRNGDVFRIDNLLTSNHADELRIVPLAEELPLYLKSKVVTKAIEIALHPEIYSALVLKPVDDEFPEEVRLNDNNFYQTRDSIFKGQGIHEPFPLETGAVFNHDSNTNTSHLESDKSRAAYPAKAPLLNVQLPSLGKILTQLDNLYVNRTQTLVDLLNDPATLDALDEDSLNLMYAYSKYKTIINTAFHLTDQRKTDCAVALNQAETDNENVSFKDFLDIIKDHQATNNRNWQPLRKTAMFQKLVSQLEYDDKLLDSEDDKLQKAALVFNDILNKSYSFLFNLAITPYLNADVLNQLLIETAEYYRHLATNENNVQVDFTCDADVSKYKNDLIYDNLRYPEKHLDLFKYMFDLSDNPSKTLYDDTRYIGTVLITKLTRRLNNMHLTAVTGTMIDHIRKESLLDNLKGVSPKNVEDYFQNGNDGSEDDFHTNSRRDDQYHLPLPLENDFGDLLILNHLAAEQNSPYNQFLTRAFQTFADLNESDIAAFNQSYQALAQLDPDKELEHEPAEVLKSMVYETRPSNVILPFVDDNQLFLPLPKQSPLAYGLLSQTMYNKSRNYVNKSIEQDNNLSPEIQAFYDARFALNALPHLGYNNTFQERDSFSSFYFYASDYSIEALNNRLRTTTPNQNRLVRIFQAIRDPRVLKLKTWPLDYSYWKPTYTSGVIGKDQTETNHGPSKALILTSDIEFNNHNYKVRQFQPIDTPLDSKTNAIDYPSQFIVTGYNDIKTQLVDKDTDLERLNILYHLSSRMIATKVHNAQVEDLAQDASFVVNDLSTQTLIAQDPRETLRTLVTRIQTLSTHILHVNPLQDTRTVSYAPQPYPTLDGQMTANSRTLINTLADGVQSDTMLRFIWQDLITYITPFNLASPNTAFNAFEDIMKA